PCNFGRGRQTYGGVRTPVVPNSARRGERGGSNGSGFNLADILQIFAGLEPNRPAGRNAHFLAGPRVAPDAALARLYLKDPESAQLDPLATLHGSPHRVEDCVD